jgi:TonB family protein
MLNPPNTKLNGNHIGLAKKQRSQLHIALAFLLVALAVLLVRDREFWFGPEATPESESSASANLPKTQPSTPAVSSPGPAQAVTTPASAAPQDSPRPSTARIATQAPATLSATKPPVAKRAELPALKVDVIARNHPHDIQLVSKASTSQAQVESKQVESKQVATITAAASRPTNAAQIEPLSTAAAPELRQTFDSTYPLLGPRMKVQGSVVLQAVIGADGNIENLRVISGPAVLTAAAQQAVRQWRFKPYMQNGEPVETKATITVNFSIRIADDAKVS